MVVLFLLFSFTSDVLQLIGIDGHQRCLGFLLFYLRIERCLLFPQRCVFLCVRDLGLFCQTR